MSEARRAARDWEADFARWAQPPSESERERCENAVRGIRDAIASSVALREHDVKVFVQGSYRNRVNVRQDSDVDVGVLCHDLFLSQLPPGRVREDFGFVDAAYSYGQFKSEIEVALVNHFGRAAVTRGNKAFDIKATGHHVEADVAPFFEFREYFDGGGYRAGVALVPDDSFRRIENYPERLVDYWPDLPLHYENGVAKNDATGRRFKGVVRILKNIRNEMDERGDSTAKAVPCYLLECMAWNAPDALYAGSTWDRCVQAVLGYLWVSTRDPARSTSWLEVDGIKFLFHGSQAWTREQAHAFVNAAWDYVGVRR